MILLIIIININSNFSESQNYPFGFAQGLNPKLENHLPENTIQLPDPRILDLPKWTQCHFQPGPTDPMSIGQGTLAMIWHPLEDSSTSYD